MIAFKKSKTRANNIFDVFSPLLTPPPPRLYSHPKIPSGRYWSETGNARVRLFALHDTPCSIEKCDIWVLVVYIRVRLLGLHGTS